MRSKKILFILIPLIIVVLALGGGFAYLMLNSTPEKIFTTSLNKVFDTLKNEKEEIKTVKGSVILTGNIDSDDEEVQAINDIFETSCITLNTVADADNMIINENIDVIYEDESLLNASVLLQDEKAYVYLPDFLDKYLEIPEDELNYAEFVEVLTSLKTLNQNQLVETFRTELLNLLLKQEFKQEKNGKIKTSILDLSQDEFYALYRELCIKLKQNQNFNNALGDYNENIVEILDDTIENLTDFKADEEKRILISIYTEGLFNKFRGFGIELKTDADVETGILFATSEQNYEFSMYSTYDGEKEEIFKVKAEDEKENKNKGTTTITVNADENEYIIIYNYENVDNQTDFKATTEIEGVIFEVLGSAIKEGNNYKGKLGLSFELEEGTININADYNFAYGVEIGKTNIEESVLIDEMSEEDQEEMMSNLQNSKLYKLLQTVHPSIDVNEGYLSDLQNLQNSEIVDEGFNVKYIVPEGFEVTPNSFSNNKTYTDNAGNLISISIVNNDAEKYLKDIEGTILLSENNYENQEFGELLEYPANEKTYKYKTLTYNIGDTSYVNLYFTYEFKDEYIYVVKVESEGGQVSLEDINMFLDITVE